MTRVRLLDRIHAEGPDSIDGERLDVRHTNRGLDVAGYELRVAGYHGQDRAGIQLQQLNFRFQPAKPISRDSIPHRLIRIVFRLPDSATAYDFSDLSSRSK